MVAKAEDHGTGLLNCLCFEHVDNLGSLQHPVGDRPSHPIRFQQLLELFPFRG
jgi:hypothetical protein